MRWVTVRLPGFHPDKLHHALAVSDPAGQQGKVWDTGTLELRQAGLSPAVRAVWERPAPPGIVQLCGCSQAMGPAVHLGIAETRQQGLGAKPVVTTD